MELRKRKPARIPKYDYSTPNYYFITICTDGKRCIFGGDKKVNQFGSVAEEYAERISAIYPNVQVDNYIVMPNHVHMILALQDVSGEQVKVTVEHVIGQYKSAVTKQIRKIDPKGKVWQRSFHDHIIRNQQEYEKIWQYVQFNWQKWEKDCFYIPCE